MNSKFKLMKVDRDVRGTEEFSADDLFFIIDCIDDFMTTQDHDTGIESIKSRIKKVICS